MQACEAGTANVTIGVPFIVMRGVSLPALFGYGEYKHILHAWEVQNVFFS
jgi:hypothetical protein